MVHVPVWLRRLFFSGLLVGMWVAYWLGTVVWGSIPYPSMWWRYTRVFMALVAPVLFIASWLVLNRLAESH